MVLYCSWTRVQWNVWCTDSQCRYPSCTACEIGMQTDHARTECLACPVPNSSTATTASPSLASCECEPGFTRNASSDTCISARSEHTRLGNAACLSCGAPLARPSFSARISRPLHLRPGLWPKPPDQPCSVPLAHSTTKRRMGPAQPPRRQHDHSTSWCHGSDGLPVYGRFGFGPGLSCTHARAARTKTGSPTPHARRVRSPAAWRLPGSAGIDA